MTRFEYGILVLSMCDAQRRARVTRIAMRRRIVCATDEGADRLRAIANVDAWHAAALRADRVRALRSARATAAAHILHAAGL